MKVGVVTIYDGLNYGAYFQALSMQKFLTSIGHDVEFVDIGIKHKNRFYQPSPTKIFSKSAVRHKWFNIRKEQRFKSSWRHLNIAKASYNAQNTCYDAIVFGSDEIWSVKNPNIVFPSECFGNNLNGGRLIAYAPSIGRSTPVEVASKMQVKEGLKNIHHLSGRDNQTCEMIRMATGRNGVKVLDPTFLSDIDELVDEENIEKSDFILIYTYGFSLEQIKISKELSMRTGLPLVSAGFIHSWCDRSLPVNPFQFLGLINRSRYVITNTFHGTCLSTILRKPFGVFSDHSPKLSDLVADLNLSAAEIVDVDTAIEMLESKHFPVEMLNIIKKKREYSTNFLKNALA